jgi:hypothetical protein
MTRWVEEHWGDENDSITFSGSTFSFMAYTPDPPKPGLTTAYRRDTQSYQMLKELVNFYRINGCIYQDGVTYATEDQISDPIPNNSANIDATASFLKRFPEFVQRHPLEGTIRERLYIRITFDYVSFVGYFESFDLIEDSTNPYKMNYDIAFKSERTKYILG